MREYNKQQQNINDFILLKIVQEENTNLKNHCDYLVDQIRKHFIKNQQNQKMFIKQREEINKLKYQNQMQIRGIFDRNYKIKKLKNRINELELQIYNLNHQIEKQKYSTFDKIKLKKKQTYKERQNLLTNQNRKKRTFTTYQKINKNHNISYYQIDNFTNKQTTNNSQNQLNMMYENITQNALQSNDSTYSSNASVFKRNLISFNNLLSYNQFQNLTELQTQKTNIQKQKQQEQEQEQEQQITHKKFKFNKKYVQDQNKFKLGNQRSFSFQKLNAFLYKNRSVNDHLYQQQVFIESH